MFGLLYLPLFLVILPLMCYWVGRLIGHGMARVLPEWSLRLVNYPVWKRNLVGSSICLALFVFMVGDEIYGKYRIETLCQQARKELPKIDENKLSNRKLSEILYTDLKDKKFFIQIFGSRWIYTDSETQEKVAEYKRYMFQNGWLTRVHKKTLPGNTNPISIAYLGRNYRCDTEPPDFKAYNAEIIEIIRKN